ncbi:hypothetical protein DENSPDRAFT_883205 [Dentipellis sp. KUC8613]|nr:hypothetical protein DENSPDRAFT_883205 [Dentipellis sp. KUC8613]
MSSSAGLTQVDDTDPSVQYSGDWKTKHGLPNAFDNTVHYTTEAGSSIQFVFSGTDLQVFGAANSPGDALNYTLDSQPLSAVPLVQSDGDHQNHNPPQMQSLIHLPDIPCSQHTLVLQPKQFMIFDQVTYSPTCPSPSDSASVTTTLVSVPTTTESSSSTSSSTAAPLRAATRSAMTTGAIAGVSIGATLFLIAIGLFLALFMRHRRQRHMKRPSAEYLASLSRAGTEPLPYGSATFGSFAQLPLYSEKQPPRGSKLNTPPAWRDEKRDPEQAFGSPNFDTPQYDSGYEPPADPYSKSWIRRPDPAQVAARSDLSQSSGEGRPVDQPRVMASVSRRSSNASTSSKLPNPYDDGWPIVR